MSFVVFGLGVLLAAAGGLSIYDGYSIIQLERGWSEVIAGATALTGGIVTIALAMILRHLQVLGELYSTSTQPLAANSVAVEPSMVPAGAAVTPPPLDHDDFGSPSKGLPSDLNQFKIKNAVDSNRLEDRAVPAARTNAGNLWDVPGVLRPAAPPAATPPPQPVYVPEPEPLEEAALVSSAAFEEVSRAAVHDPLPLEHAASPQRPQPSTTALSLDEMWKRVTEAIEKPILESHPEKPAESLPVEAEAADIEHPVHFDAPLEEPEAFAAEKPESSAEPVPEAVEAPATEAESPEPVEPRVALAEPSYTAPPAVEPPVPEPAVIGRYEAEGTSYLMFADGSIEAQSAVGIFRFASMAELKAFIEDRQAVEP